MRIFSSGVGDPMLLDSRDGLAELHDKLQGFLASEAEQFRAVAETDGDPAPYETFLRGLRISKSTGAILLRQTADEWLELSGSLANLKRYVSYLYFAPGIESDHHHPEHVDLPGYLDPKSLNLIIEADSSWK
jgi:hypothetical protein